MSDLISRKQAIDVAKRLLDYYGTNEITKEFADSLAEKFMNELPSNEWIPCKYRLPEKNGFYLVTGRQGAVNKLRFEDGRWYGNWAVIAWMPLPEPYKEEE